MKDEVTNEMERKIKLLELELWNIVKNVEYLRDVAKVFLKDMEGIQHDTVSRDNEGHSRVSEEVRD